MQGYGVVLSSELADQLRQQPLDVQGEFRAACARLVDLAVAKSVERDQLTLPGFAVEHDQTYPFGFNGAIIYLVVGEGTVEVVDAHWPTEVDEGTPAGRRERDRF